MAGRNVLNIALNYIDEHIEWKLNEITAGLQKETGFKSSFYKDCFDAVLNESLFLYIKTRKIFFICKKIQEKPTYPLSHLALDFGYSDATAMDRDFRKYVDFTPTQVLKENKFVPDNRIDVTVNRIATTNEMEDNIMTKEELRQEFLDIPDEFVEIQEEFGFSIDTCYKIAELAERLGVSAFRLANICFDGVADYLSDGENIRPEIEKCIDLELSSEAELEAICDFYECKYYEVDRRMVWFYRDRIGKVASDNEG